jgi:hypothetical protein
VLRRRQAACQKFARFFDPRLHGRIQLN